MKLDQQILEEVATRVSISPCRKSFKCSTPQSEINIKIALKAYNECEVSAEKKEFKPKQQI